MKIKHVSFRPSIFFLLGTTALTFYASTAEALAPNLVDQVAIQPTPNLTAGNPLIELPVIKSKGGSLRARATMLSADFNVGGKSIKYGDVDVLSSQSPFPNASQTSGSQPSMAYGYEFKAYGKTYPASFPGPILQLNQGEKIDIDLVDNLTTHANAMAMPMGSLYETNFHGHGLHVTPLAFGDNIYPIIQDYVQPANSTYREPEPNTTRVKIPIPKNQESGLDWYHPHRHMQTHQQLYGGLAGMIVIGNPLDPWPQYKASGTQPLKQRYIGFSEVNIQRTDLNAQNITTDGPQRLVVYAGSNPSKTSKLSTNNNCFLGNNKTVPNCAWQKRVNGQLNPVITMRPGSTEVWNLISMGAFGSFNIAVTDGDLNNPWSATILAFDGNEADNAKTQGIDMKPLPLSLSADTSRMLDFSAATLLMPGNRITMAVTAPKTPGTYYLIDGWGGCNGPAYRNADYGLNNPSTTTPSALSCSPVQVGTDASGNAVYSDAAITYYILATIKVEGAVVKEATPTFKVKGTNYDLFAATPDAKREYTFYVDAPGTYINKSEPYQYTGYVVNPPKDPCLNSAGTLTPPPPACFDINGHTFLNSPLTTVQIGSIEEWTLINERQLINNCSPGSSSSNGCTNSGQYQGSNSASHPFHIHQGNFITTEVNGQKVDPNSVSATSGLNYVSPRDNVNVPQPVPITDPATGGPVKTSIKIKFRVEDYPGKYVFHCHILKHEDQGMMVPILAVGPVAGLRNAFGSPAGQKGLVNVINGTGSKVSSTAPFGAGFSGGTSTGSALGAARFFDNFVIGQSSGGSTVAFYDGKSDRLRHRFQAFSDSIYGQAGVSVALGDINGDSQPEVIVGSRANGTPKLRIYSPSGVLMQKFDQIPGLPSGNYPNGINVAAGDVDGDNFDDVIIGTGAGQVPFVSAYSGRQLANRNGLTQVVQFSTAGDSQSGARVASGSVAPGTIPGFVGNIVTTPESGTSAGTVQVWNTYPNFTDSSKPPTLMVSYSPFPGSTQAVNLQTGYVGTPGVPQVFAWKTPDLIASTSFDSSATPLVTTNYLNLGP